MSISIRFSPDFLPSVDELEPNEIKRVMKSVWRFCVDPDANGLNLHPIKSDKKKRLYSFRASDELRVLAISLGGEQWILQEAGHHDALYHRAATGCFVAAVDGALIGFSSALDADGDEAKYLKTSYIAPKKPKTSELLSHWTDAEMKDVGFPAEAIALIRSTESTDHLLDLDIDEELILLAIDLMETTPEKYRQKAEAPALFEVDVVGETEFAETVRQYASAWGFSEFLTGEELAKLLEAPIERWMIFLHPQQQEIVDRVYAGPARIGGSAGTGKTVVALHRAASLARKFAETDPAPQVLFTTYIRSLPPYFNKLYNQLPKAVPGGVKFIHVDGLASELCRTHGTQIRVDKDQSEELFEAAFEHVVTAGSALAKSNIGKDYVLEEINAVLRGRLLSTVDEYLEIERTGRKTPLQAPLRRQIWTIAEKYASFKQEKRVYDFSDVLEEALRLSSTIKPPYRTAIIDEAQDLSLLSLRLIQNLVGESKGESKEDSLLLVGDGAQRVYASCFTLAQAGIQVRGRSTILTNNYRNTKEILEAAVAIAGGREVDDLGEVKSTTTKVSSALPPGPKPRLVTTASMEERTSYVANRINELVEKNGLGYGDIGVLAPKSFLVNGVTYGLQQLGIPAIKMKDDRSISDDQVRVGTFHRSKGLEFKAVFLLGLESYPTKMKRGEAATTFEDRHELELNVTFVAMTRAREILELVCKGEPSEPFRKASKLFETK